MMVDRAQHCITAEPVCCASPSLKSPRAPRASMSTALFSLQRKTCHFICPSLAPKHSEDSRGEALMKVAGSTISRNLIFSGFKSKLNWFMSIEHKQRMRHFFGIIVSSAYRSRQDNVKQTVKCYQNKDRNVKKQQHNKQNRLSNNAPQTCSRSSVTVRRHSKGSLQERGRQYSNRQHVAAGLEQPAAHFHNGKGQCCGFRGFRDANTIHSGSSPVRCSTCAPFSAEVQYYTLGIVHHHCKMDFF